MSKRLRNSSHFKTLVFELKLLGYHISETMLLYHFVETRGKLEFTFEGYDLPVIPKALFLFTKLRSLDLQSNQIEIVFDDIGVFTRLNRLNLSHNRIERLPSSFDYLRFLEEINLSHNNFGEININFGEFSYLSDLNLSHNYIQLIPESLTECFELEELDLSNNRISKLIDFSDFKQLHSLKLQNNSISILPESIGTLDSLKILNIENNNLRKIPYNILYNIDNYVIFNASGNHMHDILLNIEDHVYEKLLSENRFEISKISDRFPKLFEYVSDKQLVTVFLEMRLNNINLSLEKIASIFKFYDNKIDINMSNIKIDYFPISLTRIRMVHSIRMPTYLLKSLPRDIGQLRNLKILKCWNSKDDKGFVLKDLPSTIIRFTELEELDLWFNKLKSIPKVVSNLTKLKRLILAFNELSYIPHLGNLDDLELLDLREMGILHVHLSPKANVKILQNYS